MNGSRPLKTRETGSLDGRESLDGFLARALERKKHKDPLGAEQILRKAVRAYPDAASAHGLLGGLYFVELKSPRRALKCFRKTTQLSPTSELASLGVFHSLWALGRERDAMDEIKRFQAVSHCKDYDEIQTDLKAKGMWS